MSLPLPGWSVTNYPRTKNDLYGEPTRYLGANVKEYQVTHNKQSHWSIHAYNYIVESCKMVQKWSENDGHKFKNNCDDAMKTNYCPEIDISNELRDKLATQYQQMIGVLQWSIELRRVDIITKVSFLSLFNVLPREGYLEAAYRALEYLYSHKKGGCVVFDN